MSIEKSHRRIHAPTVTVSTDVTLPHTRGHGIRVDPANPEHTWRDLIGYIPHRTGPKAPILDTFRTPIRAFKVKADDAVDFIYHIPHDYVPNSPLYVHTHWAHNGTAITGNLVLDYHWTYAQGHNQAAFPAATLLKHTVTATDTPQYQHVISEVELVLDTSVIEPDGIMLMKLEVPTLPTVTGGDVFVLFGDIHYLSTNIGTISKEPDFYTR